MCGRLKYTFNKTLQDVLKGSLMQFIDTNGTLVKGKWDGFIQGERWDLGDWWQYKTDGLHVLASPISIIERNKEIPFKKKTGLLFAREDTKNQGTLLRLMTQASGEYKKDVNGHDRMPRFVRSDWKPEWNGRKKDVA